jgi:hypothetical protein
MAALSVGLLAGANGAGLRLALRAYFATLGLKNPMPRSTVKNGEK